MRANHGTLWQAVQAFRIERGLMLNEWDEVLPAALDRLRNLKCRATGKTPRDAMFQFRRKASFTLEDAKPTSLQPGDTALLRQFVRNKNDPRGNPVQIIDVWPQYAKVLRGGKVDTVNLRDLAPLPTAPSDAETDSAPSTQPLEPPTAAEQPRSRYGRLLREPAYMQDYAK